MSAESDGDIEEDDLSMHSDGSSNSLFSNKNTNNSENNMDVNNGPIDKVVGARVRQYGNCNPGPFIVFIRDVGKHIDPVKIACYLHGKYMDVMTAKNVNNKKMRVILKKRETANKILTDPFFKDYDVYIPAQMVETCGVVRLPPNSDFNDLIKHGIGKFTNVFLKNVSILDAHRFIRKSENNVEEPSNEVKVTFEGRNIPENVSIYGLLLKVRPYIPKPMLCKSCIEYGHTEKFCVSKEVRCSKCGEASHNIEHCLAEQSCCYHCKGAHQASDRNCDKWKSEFAKIRNQILGQPKEDVATMQKDSVCVDTDTRPWKPANKRLASDNENPSTSVNLYATAMAGLPTENQFALLTDEQPVPENWTSFRPILTPIKQTPRYTGTKPKRPKNSDYEPEWNNVNQWVGYNQDGQPSFADVAKGHNHKNLVNINKNGIDMQSTNLNNQNYNSINENSSTKNSVPQNSSNNNCNDNNSNNNNTSNNNSNNNNSNNTNPNNNNSSNKNSTHNKKTTSGQHQEGDNNFMYGFVAQLLGQLNLPEEILDLIVGFLSGLCNAIWDGIKSFLISKMESTNNNN